MKIFNCKVYGLQESIIRSGYPMKPYIGEIWGPIEKQTEVAIKLANSPIGSGHSNWLKGVVVQMDVEAPQYVWMQIERYQFFTIISSQSKMHKLMQMDTSNIPTVGSMALDNLGFAKSFYEQGQIPIDELMANVPMGLELTAGITTNYMCLKNMYHQRKNHRLKFWTEVFCPWVESLPMAKELIIDC